MGVENEVAVQPSNLIRITRGLVRSMRPRQWTKNGFVFAALLFDGKLFQAEPVLNALLGFAVFCFLSSAVYLVNDVVDAPADRMHPTKRYRPIARGDVPTSLALAWAALLTVVSLAAAFAVHPVAGLLGFLYVGSNVL